MRNVTATLAVAWTFQLSKRKIFVFDWSQQGWENQGMRGARWWRRLLLATVAAVLSPSAACGQEQEISAEMVRQAIQRGVGFLKQQQHRVNGTWPEMAGYEGGVTALCTLALLSAGVPADDPTVQRSLDYLRAMGRPSKTYSAALQTMVLCAAEPKKDLVLIQRNVAWLQHAQIKKGQDNGSWSYSEGSPRGDKSNAQFALLALYEAERAGVRVDETTWRRAEDYWLGGQHQDGSWAYLEHVDTSSGSMTSAGVASLVITAGRLSKGDAEVMGEQVHCCGAQVDHEAIERGLDWLGRNFSVRRNPSNSPELSRGWLLYYLYGLERVGRLTGRRFIGSHDWYREGAEFLVSMQDPLTGSWTGHSYAEAQPTIATAFALLFLSKGRRPLLVAKLKHPPEDDWNHHRSDLAHLTRYVESRWKKDMTWQVIDLEAAGVEDLLQTPVLFISGRDGLSLSSDQKKALRSYVEHGGFLFAEACCGGDGFDRQFRQLIQELFPDSPLRLLPADHPVWYAEEKVDPDYLQPLWGMEACCRTSVVYSPKDLSCYWELARPARGTSYPTSVEKQIAAAQAIGANVLAYATNRELREKLDIPSVLAQAPERQSSSRATLQIAKLRHGGGSDDAPAALGNLLRTAEQHVQLAVDVERRHLAATDPTLPDYPILFMHGRRAFGWTTAERQSLAAYLAAGGVLMADAICASPEFAESFRHEMKAIFPDRPLEPIAPTHRMFTAELGGYDLGRVTIRDPERQVAEGGPLRAKLEQTAPRLEGINVADRYVVIFSPLDISCALEYHASLECKGYIKEDAAKIGVNVILYALQ
jgi:hypothetical protein